MALLVLSHLTTTDHFSSLAVSRGIDTSLIFTLKPDCSWGAHENCPSLHLGLLELATWIECRPHPFPRWVSLGKLVSLSTSLSVKKELHL